jgi:Zn-finger nucleic acid-binding protein
MTNAAVGMPCPVCKVPLVMSDRQGVEIDYCPQCRGVWLDRGELDKIIERSAAHDAGAPPQAAPISQAPTPGVQRAPDPYAGRPAYYGDDDGRRHGHHGHPRRRKSFFEELFD